MSMSEPVSSDVTEMMTMHGNEILLMNAFLSAESSEHLVELARRGNANDITCICMRIRTRATYPERPPYACGLRFPASSSA
jgi:streptomycin 6-kinase